MDKEMTDKQQPPAALERISINPEMAARYPVSDQRVGDIEYARVQPVDEERVEKVAWEIRRLCEELTPEISGDSTSYAPSTEQIATIIQRLLPQLFSSGLCVCSHAKSQHEAFSDHDECLGCRGLDEPCSEFRSV